MKKEYSPHEKETHKQWLERIYGMAQSMASDKGGWMHVDPALLTILLNNFKPSYPPSPEDFKKKFEDFSLARRALANMLGLPDDVMMDRVHDSLSAAAPQTIAAAQFILIGSGCTSEGYTANGVWNVMRDTPNLLRLYSTTNA